MRRCLWRLGSSLDLKRAHNPKVAGSNPAPATMKNDGLADAAAASPFRLPRLHPGIGAPLGPHGATRLPEVNEAEGEWPLTWRVPAQIMRCMSPMTDFNRSRPVSSMGRSEEHTSELQSLAYLVCRLLLEKKKNQRG